MLQLKPKPDAKLVPCPYLVPPEIFLLFVPRYHIITVNVSMFSPRTDLISWIFHCAANRNESLRAIVPALLPSNFYKKKSYIITEFQRCNGRIVFVPSSIGNVFKSEPNWKQITRELVPEWLGLPDGYSRYFIILYLLNRLGHHINTA